MKVEKRFTINAPRDEVWAFVRSPEKVGECFPGCEEVTATGDNTYQAKVRVSIGPIRTMFTVDFEETDVRPGEYAAYVCSGEEGNRASRLKVKSDLTLSEAGAKRTEVEYTSEVKIVGRLGKFGSGMMQKKADSLGEEFVEALREQIEGPGAAEEARPEKEKAPGGAGRSGRRAVAAVVAAALIALLAWYLSR